MTKVFIVGMLLLLAQDKSQIPLNNPAIFMGSTFGAFFQILHKTGKYEDMLIYTSDKTKRDFDKKELLHFYENIHFSYTLHLKAITKKDDFQIMHYNTTVNATEKTIQFKVVVERDTCRVIFKKLNKKKPFIGL